MKKYNLNDMIGGWFIGNFSPSVCKRSDFEVGIKKYKKGEFENAHYHKISTEYTIVISGKVEMGGVVYYEGDIIEVEPNELIKFIALDDSITLVVKTPSVPNDKYI